MRTTSVAATGFRRVFLGWDRPALAEAAARLATQYRQGCILDLEHVIVVVPGQRAGRRLQELLAFLAEDENLRLTPPKVVTEGRLPEWLYTPKLPFANDIVQDLAWAQALRDLPPEHRQHLMAHPPAAADALRWLELGKMMRNLHCELAADGLDFAAVHQGASKLVDFLEKERWETLATVQRRYLELLDQQKLWDIQTARLKAIEFREIGTACDLVLLGTVDLNNSLRQMLEQIAGRVTAYVIAPEELADHFDAHGCLVPAAWCDAQIPLRDHELRQVNGPEEQADAVTRWLAELNGRFRKDEVAIGVPDESLVPHLQRQLEQFGVPGRWVEGVRLAETAPYRLLAAAVRFAGQRRYDDLAALLRHPDLEDRLLKALPAGSAAVAGGAAMSLPAQLDRFYNTRLPSRMRAGTTHYSHSGCPDLGLALELIDRWLHKASANRPLQDWSALFPEILSEVYGARTLHLDEPADDVLHRTMECLLEESARLACLPETLDRHPLSAADAFQVALGPLAKQALPPPADPEAVEILGWLELPLDDSPALIVTAFNEGFVAKATGPDAFLPDRLRRELGLEHNARRYARDAFALSVLCQSRQVLCLLFARRDTNNDPLQPSRLIFACPDEPLVERAKRFFGDPITSASPRGLLLAPGGTILEQSNFRVPWPVASAKHRPKINVTEFKQYLACPYRYYLRQVLDLQAVDDRARELDGGGFGTLLHRVLAILGRDAAGPRHSDKVQDIFDYLAKYLDDLTLEMYGPGQRRPAVQLQIQQARQRLKAFATRQAELVRDGWRIAYAEEDSYGQLTIPFEVDGEAIELVGRIDRIDFNETTNALRILDYKTADRDELPEKTHCKGEDWIDLQLPLYRHLSRAACLKVPAGWKTEVMELAYFNLPKQPDRSKVVCANWDDANLADADKKAQQVIRSIRDQLYWPPARPAPKYNEDLANICLDNVLSPPPLADAEEGAPA